MLVSAAANLSWKLLYLFFYYTLNPSTTWHLITYVSFSMYSLCFHDSFFLSVSFFRHECSVPRSNLSRFISPYLCFSFILPSPPPGARKWRTKWGHRCKGLFVCLTCLAQLSRRRWSLGININIRIVSTRLRKISKPSEMFEREDWLKNWVVVALTDLLLFW